MVQTAFFALFILAPPLDLLRFDLYQGHFVFFGFSWTLGIDAFVNGEVDTFGALLNLIVRGFVPAALTGATLLFVAWRFGRLYCGWLCPHFAVVEIINALMRRAIGRPTLWEKGAPHDAAALQTDRRYWLLVGLAALLFAVLWAVVFLTYLLPPEVIYSNLMHGTLTPNQSRFITVTTLVVFLEFIFARHLFCRYGCTVGIFQSLVWMANDRALVVGFDRDRARLCCDCDNACDDACPMRLKPRTIKRSMVTCTACTLCITACEQVQADNPAGGLLEWVVDDEALPVVTGRPVTDKRRYPQWKNRLDNSGTA